MHVVVSLLIHFYPSCAGRTVMLAQSTDSGHLIAAAVIKLFHAMKLQVQDLRGVGIQVQLLEGHHSGPPQDATGHRSRSIKEMLLGQGLSAKSPNRGLHQVFVFQFSCFDVVYKVT